MPIFYIVYDTEHDVPTVYVACSRVLLTVFFYFDSPTPKGLHLFITKNVHLTFYEMLIVVLEICTYQFFYTFCAVSSLYKCLHVRTWISSSTFCIPVQIGLIIMNQNDYVD